ncbi:N-acetylglucosaminyl-phosphatidylinositol de-N-acetylase isoform X4 [Neoarius graeffei]|uniref:N-acetylglucosaminyl-phosphatidylinositol de-N-acetylase isoform X4 n=1 Tax=Neoarius graeffei TaxID=443677 RepID=UPI00298BE0E4|nr:N-acetylglucosaminyl-phosphatidylinositol de-N-acetylase isoform X4 [Neoarius graeffei]
MSDLGEQLTIRLFTRPSSRKSKVLPLAKHLLEKPDNKPVTSDLETDPSRELQDDPKIEWSIALTASLILKHITTYSINLVCRPNEITWDYLSQVLTFDEGGVSGHANHIAIYKALGHLAFVGRIPEGCQVLSLHTISILRKYLSLFELPISWLLPSSFCCIIGPNEYKKAKEAMLHHRSQLLWFRRLYILFSRYMYINTFRAMPVEKKDVKFY